MSNLLKLTPENYYTKEANMQYVSVSQYQDTVAETYDYKPYHHSLQLL